MLYFLTCFAGWKLGLSRPEQEMQTDMENVSISSAGCGFGSGFQNKVGRGSTWSRHFRL